MPRAFAYILCALLMSMPSAWAQAANGRYATERLQLMAEALGLDAALALADDGERAEVGHYMGRPLTATVRHGVVEHLGFKIFSPWQRLGTNKAIFDFVERYALEQTLLDRQLMPESAREMQEEVDFGSGSLADLLALPLNNKYSVDALSRDGRTTLAWRSKSTPIFTMSFANNYSMLSGATMVENENRLQRCLQNHVFNPSPLTLPEPEALEQVDSADCYALRIGRSPQGSLEQALYFATSTGEPELLFSSDRPAESLANLLSASQLQTSVTANVHLIKYNAERAAISMPAAALIDYLASEGCTPYFGILDYDSATNSIVAVVRMQNEPLGYVHMLKVVAPVGTLFGPDATIDVDIAGYITGASLWDLNP